jgi:hypothetical protein
MLLVGGVSYLLGGLWLAVELLRGMRAHRDLSRNPEPSAGRSS